MHSTPLRVDKIGRILNADFRSTAFPTYRCGAGDGQSVRRRIAPPPF
jgi:hypothetical protein